MKRKELTVEEKATNHDTWRHINRVQALMVKAIERLMGRLIVHDQSKLETPEVEAFTRVTPKLKGLTYGSEEYKASLREIKDAIAHHKSLNSHHPEFYQNGVAGMDLLDLLEMLCDWKAASERHDNGDMVTSLKINAKRFKITSQLQSVLENTTRRLGMIKS